MNSSGRTALVAPASDERKARKAIASDADLVILDLEDAVVPDLKEEAREAAAELVADFGSDRPVSIRINAVGTTWVDDDLRACATMESLHSVVLPKAETEAQIADVDRALGASTAALHALVETALGVQNVDRIAAASPRLAALVIGYADLAADLGRTGRLPPAMWAPIRDRILIAARAARIDAVDGPHLTVTDDDGFRTAKEEVRDLGFDGTWVIHPQQLATAASIFTPDADAVHDAERVLAALDGAAATGSGAVSLDGRMLDEALAAAARRTLRKAGRHV